MAKTNKTSKNRAYAVALTVASRTSSPVSGVSADSIRIAKERSEKRSADDLNRMFAEAFEAVYK
ncbi:MULTISPECIES: hypothetical protein [Enterobacterales]|uniref:hypothetical protein n=1 Tax=Enterobacterales TaxID=91347 RepID=UPI000F892C47|nr:MULTISPECIES: hypothetical protein [Enterobacterales]EKY3091098.1 hypothetical protein [Cronobacter dublinensis]RTO60608.1 hypothetical protein EKN65_09075 [Enterobacter cloacae]UUP54200.1 hypothetical protein KFU68_09035 [Escherichia coli]